MRYITTSCVLLASVLLSCPKPAVAKDRTPSDYYPLKVGTKWLYRVQGQTGRVTNLVSKTELIDGQQVACVETTFQDKVIPTEHLANTPQGLFRYRSHGIGLSPPLCLLRYPVKKGDSWKSKIVVGGQQEVHVSCCVGAEKVTVPAGTYDAVTIDVVLMLGDTIVGTSKYWLAAGVGMVKQNNKASGTTTVFELEKFEPAR